MVNKNAVGEKTSTFYICTLSALFSLVRLFDSKNGWLDARARDDWFDGWIALSNKAAFLDLY